MKEYEIKITGEGTTEEIISSLQKFVNIVNGTIDFEETFSGTWEDEILFTVIHEKEKE